jgi:hypothetical protein
MNYHKKQRKHTRSIYLNTDEAFFVDSERKTFRFRINPINIEDESKLYVKNTITDYRGSGLAVKSVNTGLFLGSTATYTTTYSANPAITFVPQDGKGTGATAIGTLAPSGLSGSATSSTLVVNATAVGQGYTGTAPTISANVPNTGGSGATLTPTGIDSINGGFLSTATLVAGSGYTEPATFTIPAPQASVPATFDVVPHTNTTGVITGVPNVLNTTTNGFYNTNLFAVGFVNNPITATGVFQTNATGGFTSIIIDNSGANGYYGTDHPITLPFAVGGTGFTFTPTYSQGRCVSIIITASGTGYGNNLVDYPFTAGLPATPVAGSITGKTIANGRLTALTFGTGGSKYRNPSVSITGGLVAPIQASYEPVFKIASAIAGARMLTHGRGYTLPPKPVIDSTYRVANNGDLPLIAEMTQPYNVEKNNYYTIKAEGFHFSRTLYTNTDNKGTPTLAICSQNEDVNNENYTELILPAQVINDITLTITDRDGNGLDALKNMIMLLTIEELPHDETHFHDSKRQEYSAVYSVS